MFALELEQGQSKRAQAALEELTLASAAKEAQREVEAAGLRERVSRLTEEAEARAQSASQSHPESGVTEEVAELREQVKVLQAEANNTKKAAFMKKHKQLLMDYAEARGQIEKLQIAQGLGAQLKAVGVGGLASAGGTSPLSDESGADAEGAGAGKSEELQLLTSQLRQSNDTVSNLEQMLAEAQGGLETLRATSVMELQQQLSLAEAAAATQEAELQAQAADLRGAQEALAAARVEAACSAALLLEAQECAQAQGLAGIHLAEREELQARVGDALLVGQELVQSREQLRIAVEEAGAAQTELAAAQEELSAVRAWSVKQSAEVSQLRESMAEREEALLGSEEALRGAEEAAWTGRAEASELMFALELEQGQSKRAQAALEEITLRAVAAEAAVEAAAKAAEAAEVAEASKGATLQGDSQTDSALQGLLDDALRDLAAAHQQIEAGELAEGRVREALGKQERLSVELGVSQAAAVGTASAMGTLKAQIQKHETESKQLHQIISQLRQARKSNQGDAASAVLERDELRVQCAQLQTEGARMQRALEGSGAASDALAYMKQELAQSLAGLETARAGLDEARRRVAQLEQQLYDRDAELEVTQADMLISRQALEQQSTEAENLKEALEQLQSESSVGLSRLQREMALKLQQVQHLAQEERAGQERELGRQVEEERQQCASLAAQQQDRELLLRKAELDFHSERRKMQRTLESALSQLNNSQADVIDRMLVGNLIVSYFQRRRSPDVLKIIAKVLAFSDSQLVAVGLKVAPDLSLLSLLSSVIGQPTRPVVVAGDNLAEQWISYLINETGDDNTSPGLSPRTPGLGPASAHTSPETSGKGPGSFP